MSRTNVTEPTKPWTWYTGNSVISAGGFTYPSGYTEWKSMPSAEVFDSLSYEAISPFGPGLKPDSIVRGGPGSGASVTLLPARAGDIRSRGSAPYYQFWTADDMAFGIKINRAILTSLGRNYRAPVLAVSGTQMVYLHDNSNPDDPPPEGYYRSTVNGSPFFVREESITFYFAMSTVALELNYYVWAIEGGLPPLEVNTRMKELIQTNFNGADYRWGEWTNKTHAQGEKLTAQLPSVSVTITNNTPANPTKASWWNDFKNKFWEAIFAGPASYGDIYFVLMYGPNGAKAALDAGQITPEQFNLLKGYYGSQFLTGTVFGSTTLLNTLTTNGTPLAGLSLPLQATVKNLEIVISTILNAGHQLGQAWKNYVNSRQGELVPSIELYDVTPSKQDYTGAFTAQSRISTAKSLLDYIYDEIDDFKQQTLGSMKTTASKPDFAGFSVKNRTYTTRNPLNGNTITFTFDSNGDWTKTETSN